MHLTKQTISDFYSIVTYKALRLDAAQGRMNVLAYQTSLVIS